MIQKVFLANIEIVINSYKRDYYSIMPAFQILFIKKFSYNKSQNGSEIHLSDFTLFY